MQFLFLLYRAVECRAEEGAKMCSRVVASAQSRGRTSEKYPSFFERVRPTNPGAQQIRWQIARSGGARRYGTWGFSENPVEKPAGAVAFCGAFRVMGNVCLRTRLPSVILPGACSSLFLFVACTRAFRVKFSAHLPSGSFSSSLR